MRMATTAPKKNLSTMDTKYIVVLFFVASASAIELVDHFHDQREKCREWAGLTREQLAQSKHHLERAGDYFVCFVAEIGIPTKNGLLDVDTAVKVATPVSPPVLSRPIVKCCNSYVSASEAETPTEQMVVFVKCLVKKLSKVDFDATGYLKPPVYRRLDTC